MGQTGQRSSPSKRSFLWACRTDVRALPPSLWATPLRAAAARSAARAHSAPGTAPRWSRPGAARHAPRLCAFLSAHPGGRSDRPFRRTARCSHSSPAAVPRGSGWPPDHALCPRADEHRQDRPLAPPGSGSTKAGILSPGTHWLPPGSAQLMDYRLVSFPPQLPQESPHLPLGDADLLGSLLLRDQFLLGLLQGHQPVALGLGHQQLSFVHPPGWTLSIGHFYFAQIGHYYFAATLLCAHLLRSRRLVTIEGSLAVGLAQLVERQIVVLEVVGSNPTSHPTFTL